jgi:hypothetical protein
MVSLKTEISGCWVLKGNLLIIGISNFIQMRYSRIISMSYIRHRFWYMYMYMTFPVLNDNMTSKREKAKWKTIDSFFTKPVSTETKDSCLTKS